jgi:hypothetical protein
MQDKVVAHFLNGYVLKGITSDFSPNKKGFHLVDDNTEVHTINISDLKALFFVKNFEGNPDYNDKHDVERKGLGSRIKVDFKDGESLVGYSKGTSEKGMGFLITPVDPDSNNIKIFINKEATSNVSLAMAPAEPEENSGEQADETIVMSCPMCGVKNKINTSNLEMKPKCGKCGGRLM